MIKREGETVLMNGRMSTYRMIMEENKNEKRTCLDCGREIFKKEDEVKGTNKCKSCYYQEAKIFFWVIGAIVFLLLTIGLIKYLVV